MAERSPGTWRRLKMASEARRGHRIPALRIPELVRMLGLLAAIRDGNAESALGNEAVQEEMGHREAARVLPGRTPETGALIEAIRKLSRIVDVGPHL